MATFRLTRMAPRPLPLPYETIPTPPLKEATVRNLALLWLLALIGCNGLDQSACPTQDFAALGRSEGLRAAPASVPAPGCALSAEQLAEYQRARDEGLARYCGAARGYVLGLEGQAIDPAQCSADDAAELQRGHKVGITLREQLAARDQLLRQAQELEGQANAHDDESARLALTNDAALARAQARLHENEIEALRGVAAVEQWR